jgi:hypothetical protein
LGTVALALLLPTHAEAPHLTFFVLLPVLCFAHEHEQQSFATFPTVIQNISKHQILSMRTKPPIKVQKRLIALPGDGKMRKLHKRRKERSDVMALH